MPTTVEACIEKAYNNIGRFTKNNVATSSSNFDCTKCNIIVELAIASSAPFANHSYL
jgi:hypothetical protein